MHSTDGWKDGFTMFNVYISGAAVTQGCNVVGSEHGNISRLVSGYSEKIKTSDKLSENLNNSKTNFLKFVSQ